MSQPGTGAVPLPIELKKLSDDQVLEFFKKIYLIPKSDGLDKQFRENLVTFIPKVQEYFREQKKKVGVLSMGSHMTIREGKIELEPKETVTMLAVMLGFCAADIGDFTPAIAFYNGLAHDPDNRRTLLDRLLYYSSNPDIDEKIKFGMNFFATGKTQDSIPNFDLQHDNNNANALNKMYNYVIIWGGAENFPEVHKVQFTEKSHEIFELPFQQLRSGSLTNTAAASYSLEELFKLIRDTFPSIEMNIFFSACQNIDKAENIDYSELKEMYVKMLYNMYVIRRSEGFKSSNLTRSLTEQAVQNDKAFAIFDAITPFSNEMSLMNLKIKRVDPKSLMEGLREAIQNSQYNKDNRAILDVWKTYKTNFLINKSIPKATVKREAPLDPISEEEQRKIKRRGGTKRKKRKRTKRKRKKRKRTRTRKKIRKRKRTRKKQ